MISGKAVNKIGIVFNLKRKGASDDRYEEYDEIETIESLKKEIEKHGFEVVPLEQNGEFLKRLSEVKPDFVFNIAEGTGHSRSRESQVPCVLESLGIPYSGSDPLSLGITLDKYLTNRILQSAGIPVPQMFLVQNNGDAIDLKNIFKRNRLFIVKPRWEGSSKGIFLNSVVSNFKDLKKRVESVFEKYRQPAVVEEFLEKDEITVGVCGNSPPRLAGMMRVAPKKKIRKFFIYSLETKREWKTKVKYEPEKRIPEKTRLKIEGFALRAFITLDLRDIARIDFRLDKSGIPRIIDINPLPGLSPLYSDLPILYRLKDRKYSDLIKDILRESFMRQGLKWKKSS